MTKQAFGAPGIGPRWTNGAKEGIGTAYAASSRLWFTLWRGVVTEVYYPTIDLPQIRDWQLLITDGESFFHEEKRDLATTVERIGNSLGYTITNTAPDGRYRLIKEVITDPHLPCVLMRVRLEGDEAIVPNLRIYTLCAPHLNACGWDNTGVIRTVAGQKILCAKKGPSNIFDSDTHLAIGANVPIGAASAGFVGTNDGWTDLRDNFQLDWQFDTAEHGNIALVGEILAPLHDNVREFTLVLAFGDGEHRAHTNVLQSLGVPYAEQRAKFLDQWSRPARHLLPLEDQSFDGGKLYRASHQVLLAHEDKRYPGALIASLSIPWGEVKSDEETGGYHLVWPRDMVHSATALLAVGSGETAFRALIYLAASQYDDGAMAQNFWLDGHPYWKSLQLDEVAFPLLLVHVLKRCEQNGTNALKDFDPTSLVERAARFLIVHGPCTPQERWEEASGFSPSTLAAVIAGLIAAAAWLRAAEREDEAVFIEEYADWLETNLELFCVTREGNLVPGEPEYYVRINPRVPATPMPTDPPGQQQYKIASRPPGTQEMFEAREIVDGGFLELVRYGIRRPDDPLILATIRVMDEVLKVETEYGTCYRRYNHDGYGQQDDGAAYETYGTGRGWPLLGGERGHYEIAAGGDPDPWIRSMETFASPTGMLPEQIWDADDLPSEHMFKGLPTGSAQPLAWAHAEYLKLLRSRRDGVPFDRVEEAYQRYALGVRPAGTPLTLWGRHYPSTRSPKNNVLRIVASEPFRLHWSSDNWNTVRDAESQAFPMGVYYVDLTPTEGSTGWVFTFFYPEQNAWEGRDYQVERVD